MLLLITHCILFKLPGVRCAFCHGPISPFCKSKCHFHPKGFQSGNKFFTTVYSYFHFVLKQTSLYHCKMAQTSNIYNDICKCVAFIIPLIHFLKKGNLRVIFLHILIIVLAPTKEKHGDAQGPFPNSCYMMFIQSLTYRI